MSKLETNQKHNESKFQFSLMINNNIVVERFFDVRDFNPESIKSLEVKDLMDTIFGDGDTNNGHLGIIPTYLKDLSVDYLWNNYNPHFQQTDENMRINSDKNDMLQFEIRYDKKLIGKSEIRGNSFPPRVRYSIDIKPIIPQILSEIRYYLSRESYTLAY